jgi:ATP citrate (pro-S)-lyase
MKISEVFREDIGLGGVAALIWFKRRTCFFRSMFSVDCLLIGVRFLALPPWATNFIEMVLMLTADHGPAVSGVMNTIVATRAGKDLISSLASGLLTIGGGFGGALDEAASMFSNARDTGLTPREFVDQAGKQCKHSTSIRRRVFVLNGC